jgi:hypothetical protein
MNHAHLEFLSHEDIDRDVERVYRAYCDATLLEFAKSPDPAEYWAQVVTFRRKNFGPLDRSEFVERARAKVEAVPPENQRQRWAEEGHNFTGRLEFLYWFDVRADFWSTLDKRKLDKEVVVTAEQLEMLYGEILAAKRRLQEAEGGDGNWSCRNRNHEILQSLPHSPPKTSGTSSAKRGTSSKKRGTSSKKRGTSSPQSPPPSSTPSDESS